MQCMQPDEESVHVACGKMAGMCMHCMQPDEESVHVAYGKMAGVCMQCMYPDEESSACIACNTRQFMHSIGLSVYGKPCIRKAADQASFVKYILHQFYNSSYKQQKEVIQMT